MAISPSTITALGKEVVHFVSDSPGVWTSSVGTLYTNAAATTPYSGTSRSDIYLKVQNKTSGGTVSCGSSTATVTVIGVYPSVPHFPHDLDVTKRGIVSMVSRSGKISGRVLGDGTLKVDPRLVHNLRPLVEANEVRQFVDDHFPELSFYYRDGVFLAEYELFKLNGNPPMKVTYQGSNRMSFEVALFML